jgi:hypothetical protein
MVWPGDKGKQENRRQKLWSVSYNFDYHGETAYGFPEEEEQFVIRKEEDRERRDDGTGEGTEDNRKTGKKITSDRTKQVPDRSGNRNYGDRP